MNDYCTSFKINETHFDTFVKRDAYRNGYDFCTPIAKYKYRLSSSGHSSTFDVTYDEDGGFNIYSHHDDKVFKVGDVMNLASTLGELTQLALARKKNSNKT